MLERRKQFASQVLLVPRQVLLGTAMAAAAVATATATGKDEERKESMEGKSIKEKKEKKERKEKNKKKKKQSETLEPDTANVGEKCKDALLRSIAAFLECNGFSKTLSALLSEARFEVSHHESPVVDLEDLFGKSFHSSIDPEKITSAKGTKEDELQKDDISEEAEGQNTDNIYKQSQKKNDKANGDVKTSGLQNGSLEGAGHDDMKEPASCERNRYIKQDTLVETKEKKKRKKSVSSSLWEDVENKLLEVNHRPSDYDLVSQIPDLKGDNKDKKKKHKNISDSLNTKAGEPENFKEIVKESIEELKSLTKSCEPKDKGEKKKVKKAREDQQKTSEDTPRKMPDLVEGEKSNVLKNKCDMDQDVGKSISTDKSASANDENIAEISKKSSKKRKRKASEEADIKNAGDMPKVETDSGQSNETTNIENDEKSNIEHPIHNKKMKTEEVSGKFAEKEAENEMTNGKVEKNGVEVISPKAIKKEKKSKEEKSGTPFQRIKVDEVKFADDRLKDNSYWAKDGADSGYGAKAQEVLGQVRGRDFRHEKTKKKRGTYRGGLIDMQSHSIKFTNSDED